MEVIDEVIHDNCTGKNLIGGFILNKKIILVSVSVLCLVLMLAVVLMTGACKAPEAKVVEPEAPEVIEVRGIHPFPYDHLLSWTYREIGDRINEMGQGRLIFTDLGGGEVAPAFEQLKLVMAGTADLIETATAYAASDFYEALPLDPGLAGPTGTEVREAGMIDALDRMAREQIGVGFLASNGFFNFNAYTTTPVTTLADFEGMKMRSVGTYDFLAKQIGIASVIVSPGEVYTALETGIVEGVFWPGRGIVDYGWEPFLKYQVYPDFWRCSGMGTYVNAEWFDGLPEWARDIVTAAVLSVERDGVAIAWEQTAVETRQLREKGIEAITIDEASWWEIQQIIYEQTNKALRDNAPANAEEIIHYMDLFYPPDEVWYPPFDWR